MATTAEIKIILDAWVPKYIQQVVALRAGGKLTAERFNELMNLLIQQGDDTIGLITKVKEYIDAFAIEEAEARTILTEFVNTTASDLTDLVDQARADVVQMGLRVDGYHNTVMAEVGDAIGTVQEDINSIRAALTAAGAVVEDANAIYTAIENKLDLDDLPTSLPANGGNANTLGELPPTAFAKAPADYTVTVHAVSWRDTPPFTHTVVVDGLTTTDVPIVGVVLSADDATAKLELKQFSYIAKAVAWTNTLTLTCLDKTPTIDLNLKIRVVR